MDSESMVSLKLCGGTSTHLLELWDYFSVAKTTHTSALLQKFGLCLFTSALIRGFLLGLCLGFCCWCLPLCLMVVSWLYLLAGWGHPGSFLFLTPSMVYGKLKSLCISWVEWQLTTKISIICVCLNCLICIEFVLLYFSYNDSVLAHDKHYIGNM